MASWSLKRYGIGCLLEWKIATQVCFRNSFQIQQSFKTDLKCMYFFQSVNEVEFWRLEVVGNLIVYLNWFMSFKYLPKNIMLISLSMFIRISRLHTPQQFLTTRARYIHISIHIFALKCKREKFRHYRESSLIAVFRGKRKPA